MMVILGYLSAVHQSIADSNSVSHYNIYDTLLDQKESSSSQKHSQKQHLN